VRACTAQGVRQMHQQNISYNGENFGAGQRNSLHFPPAAQHISENFANCTQKSQQHMIDANTGSPQAQLGVQSLKRPYTSTFRDEQGTYRSNEVT
jgi:hypothetical protein